MSKLPAISDAEWQVMRIVWDHAPISAGQIVDHLAEPNDWHPKTIKTMLSRLTKKGALTFQKSGNRYIYKPAVSESKCVRQQSRSFLDRIFDGDAASAVMHFAQNTDLTEEQISELKSMLEDKK